MRILHTMLRVADLERSIAFYGARHEVTEASESLKAVANVHCSFDLTSARAHTPFNLRFVPAKKLKWLSEFSQR